MLTQARLKELLNYDSLSGVFTWARPQGCMAIGSMAGTKDRNGYIQIMIDKKRYLAHRLAWLYVCGEFPDKEIDHINRNPSDNCICNLRTATRLENQQNHSVRKDNKSGIVGVSWHKASGKWRAQIRFFGRKIDLGIFPTAEEACAARAEAKAKYHTFHPKDNNVTLSKETPDHRDHNSRD